METNKHYELEELIDLLDQVDELSYQIKTIMQQAFPSKAYTADAYGCFEMTSSRNPYDTTLRGLVETIAEELEEEE